MMRKENSKSHAYLFKSKSRSGNVESILDKNRYDYFLIFLELGFKN